MTEYEYTVMTQIGDEEPVEADYTHDTFEKADRACNKMWNSLSDLRYGITVTNAEEARRVADDMERAEITRYFVAKRPKPEPWEECWECWD